jgi:hypothetical protein
MNPVRYFNFFKKFYNNELDILGIKLIPFSINSDYRIIFKLKNPKDLPYSSPALFGYVQEHYRTFHNFFGIPPHHNEYGVFILDFPEIYVNEELLTRTNSILKNKKHLELPKNKYVKQSLIFNVTNLEFNYSIIDKEMIKLTNIVNVNTVYNTDEGFDIMDIKSSIEQYEDFIIRGRFDDSESNYLGIDELLKDYPTFQDHEWQVNYTVTEFVSGL